jgi:hypothetical protein
MSFSFTTIAVVPRNPPGQTLFPFLRTKAERCSPGKVNSYHPKIRAILVPDHFLALRSAVLFSGRQWGTISAGVKGSPRKLHYSPPW